jgi:hypothetical protein
VVDNTNKEGFLNPETAYQFRKTGLGQIIADNAGQDLNAAKFAKVHVARGVQQALDEAIVKAGGTEWPTYLEAYSARMKPIDAAQLQTEEMYTPQQRTAVEGGGSMRDGATAPHVFSRTASMANYGLGLRRALMGKAVNRTIADTMLNPPALAETLAKGTRPIPKSNISQFPPPSAAPPPVEPTFPPSGTPLANNASGESAASLEAQNRPKRNLALVDPDANSTPVLKDVTQVDRQAPKGHIIIDRDTGEIVSRGADLTQAHANGLRARYKAKNNDLQDILTELRKK